MKRIISILCVCFTFFLNISIASAADRLLSTALTQQIKIWDAEVSQSRGSHKCNEAFHGAAGKYMQQTDIPASWDRLKNISQLCEIESDALGEGLIWTDMYVKLASDEKGQVLNRPYLLGAINRALVLLTISNLSPKLKASLTALATEIAHNNQKFPQVVAFTENAEAQFAGLGVENALSLAVAISNRGYAKRKMGDPASGLKDLLRAEKMLYRLAKTDQAQLATIYRRLATIYDLMGNPHQAIKYNEKAKNLFDEFGAKIHSANLNFNKGIILLDVGLYDQAVDAFTEAKNIYLLNGKEKQIGRAFFNLGKAWYKKGSKERALNYYKQAERILTVKHDYIELAKVYISMGIFYENRMSEEAYRKAHQYYVKAEDLFNTYSRQPQEDLRVLAINKGKLYERWGKYEEAHNEYLRAEEHLSGARVYERSVIHNNLAYTSLLRKDYDQALAYAQKSLEELEKTLAMAFYFAGTPNLRFIDQHLSPYVVAVKALVQKGELDKAYALREKSRNKLFQIMVRMKGADKKEEGIEDVWQQKIQLDSALSSLEKRAVQSTSDSKRENLLSQRNELKKKLGSVERRLFSNPELYRKIFESELLDVSKLQSNLKNDEALIDYQVLAQAVPGDIRFQINAFVIKRGKIRFIRLFEEKDAYEILKLVKEYNNLQRPQILQRYYSKGEINLYKQSIQTGAKKLYQGLFEKLSTELKGVTKVFIVPDGMLNFLPFETLRDQQNKLLLEKYAISYLNSAADLFPNSAKPNNNLLVFGDIDYGPSDKEFREWSSIEGSADILSNIVNSMQGKMLTTYVHKTDATESHFKQVSPGHSVVLIWSHGEFSAHNQMPEILKEAQDEKGGLSIKNTTEFDTWYSHRYRKQFNDPLSNSFVTLAAVNQGGDGANDGYLTAREVMGLNLQGTKLTILAACETGVGQSSPSEGVLGLRKAFSLAGSRQLLISLWQVDVRWTGELIKAMLSNYEAQGGARALQKAKIALIKKLHDEGLEPFPFYWAGFILVGKGN